MQDKTAFASVIKDAGDDPDVTHGAEIRAAGSECGMLRMPITSKGLEIMIKGGKGVGRVTKPGLAIPVGEAGDQSSAEKDDHAGGARSD